LSHSVQIRNAWSAELQQFADTIFAHRSEGESEVVVVVPVFNNSEMVTEALASVVEQDFGPLGVIVVDDCSDDDSGKRAAEFLNYHRARFTRAHVVRHRRNLGVALARNSAITLSTEPFIFMLDSDNRLRPPALQRLLAALHSSLAHFAYSQLRLFGDEEGVGEADVWDPQRLIMGNYIDAMALIRRDALLAAGGYSPMAVEQGWEDYDLWCRFAELGFEGVFLPELLCEYRVHGASMLRTRTNNNHSALLAEMWLRHPKLFGGNLLRDPAIQR
jgi:glycosyltransferase involved in cell wall biosynthesis